MSLFVDTSALYAILDADDLNHASAKVAWTELVNGTEELISTNYVLVESVALVQHRLGIEAVKTFQQGILPILQIEWLDQSLHTLAVNKLLAMAQRQISLVDWTSFLTMQRLGINTAFAFDQDFMAQGFECMPSTNKSN